MSPFQISEIDIKLPRVGMEPNRLLVWWIIWQCSGAATVTDELH